MFDLARELGMTVRQLEENLYEDEITYWRAYFTERTLAEDGEELRNAQLMRLHMALNTQKKDRSKLPSLRDLLPDRKF